MRVKVFTNERWQSKVDKIVETMKNIFPSQKKDRFRSVEVRIVEVAWLNNNVDKFYKFLN